MGWSIFSKMGVWRAHYHSPGSGIGEWVAGMAKTESLRAKKRQGPAARELYMVGLIVRDMPAAVAFYRHLGAGDTRGQ
jgi:hypothetical protein